MNDELYQNLSISEVERLAKAGVPISLCKVVPTPDPYMPPPPSRHSSANMADAIWDRWHRAKTANNSHDAFTGYIRPYDILATRHNDKVYVSVHPTNLHPPFMLEDVAAIFPSDALMASLALWEKEHLP